jgi:hypothetical protein
VAVVTMITHPHLSAGTIVIAVVVALAVAVLSEN